MEGFRREEEAFEDNAEEIVTFSIHHRRRRAAKEDEFGQIGACAGTRGVERDVKNRGGDRIEEEEEERVMEGRYLSVRMRWLRSRRRIVEVCASIRL